MTNKVYQIALSMLSGIGPRIARNMVSYVGSVEGIFKENASSLEKIPGLGKAKIAALNIQETLENAEKELENMANDGIDWVFYLDPDYPSRLKECEDAPVVLYYRGKDCFESEKIISIVGTRKSTEYGEKNTLNLVEDLAEVFPGLVIVSGFAYGIDIEAHKAAMQYNLKTIAVFGTGLDYIYPTFHRKYIKDLLSSGCVCSEFPLNKKIDPGNFVSRNRIIAGLSDATVVVESGKKGGSLLTAEMANSYHRDVFSFPGRIDDKYSKGCNQLIKNNQAVLIENAEDLILHMRWEDNMCKKPVQASLFTELSADDLCIVNLLDQKPVLTIDEMAKTIKQPVSKISAQLLSLEFKGIIKALPGKSFRLIR
jgi:DNA processing protein